MKKPTLTGTGTASSEIGAAVPVATERSQQGFTLIEVVVAFVIITVALLGVFATFTYAINYNSGNNFRAQALSVLQQEVEQIRSAKFTPYFTDSTLTGGVKDQKTIAAADGSTYHVNITVDNDPFTSGVQDETTATTMKEVTLTVTLSSPTPGWQTSVPATVILRRVRGN